MKAPDLDCLVIGGGPAGLTAAIYLARFHLKLRVVDAGKSRAALIPCTRNHAGFPDGISGQALIERMKAQAQKYGAAIETGRVTRLDRIDGGFEAEWGAGPVAARTVLLATGVANRRPPMDESLHDEALARGLIRYCPICDGYEVTDKRVGVIGTGDHGMREALFLRGFTRDVTLIAPGAAHDLDDSCRAKLEEAGIVHVDGPCTPIRVDGDRIVATMPGGDLAFDSIYPALGSRIRSKLAVDAGARASDDGCLEVDAHQRTTLPGLFAAGDVVKGLDQISHAMGEAGVAATTIRNLLDEKRPLRR
jgi:thioredoxin reductase (NADPH)